MKHGIRITFLGTGTSQGIPVIACECEVCKSTDAFDHRLRSSILIESATTTVVIDTGPDFRYQMLRESIKKINAVVFTHEHRDHIAGLDDIRAFNFKQGESIPLYCTAAVEKAIRRDFHYAFAETKYPGVPEMHIIPIHDEPFMVGDIPFLPIKVLHYKMPVLGFRIHNFTYITDASFIADEELNKVMGSDIVVLNALRKQTHISHFNLEQALQIMDYLKPQEGYFTHISHLLGLHREVQLELPPNIKLAFDGLKIEI
ncbi:MAG: MBL fold metallo-hydrolase [Flavobacteriales bacterium]|nr:MBL fold metallo-hydrolase [Flavobacteriales bacterium]